MGLVRRRIRASEIDRFQAAASMTSGPTVLRYALAVRTARGAITLPITTKSIDGSDAKDGLSLIARAQWLAGVLGIPGVSFDPRQWPATNRRCAISPQNSAVTCSAKPRSADRRRLRTRPDWFCTAVCVVAVSAALTSEKGETALPDRNWPRSWWSNCTTGCACAAY